MMSNSSLNSNWQISMKSMLMWIKLLSNQLQRQWLSISLVNTNRSMVGTKFSTTNPDPIRLKSNWDNQSQNRSLQNSSFPYLLQYQTNLVVIISIGCCPHTEHLLKSRPITKDWIGSESIGHNNSLIFLSFFNFKELSFGIDYEYAIVRNYTHFLNSILDLTVKFGEFCDFFA